jgi:hypothetical protein
MVGRGSGAYANGSRRDWCPPESMASCAKTLPSPSERSAASLRFDLAARWERLGPRTGPIPPIFRREN